MILKNKECIECGRTDKPHFSKKRCRYCATISYKKPSKQTVKNKQKKDDKYKKLNVYFKYHTERCKYSEESGISIQATTANICHLIDKGRHNSIASNLINCIYLTLDEHTELDGYLFTHKFDKVEERFKNSFKKMVARWEKLLPLCQERTKFIIELEEYLENRKTNEKN